MKEMIVVPTVPYSHDQLMRDVVRLKRAYPAWVSSEDAGYSQEGRALPLIRLGTGRIGLFCCGAHHAREYVTSAYLMYAVNVYAHMASTKKHLGRYNMEKLLNECSMYVMPMVNPDGVTLAQGGLKAVQQPEDVARMTLVRPSYCEWKANVNGIDLNRHYPVLWEQRYTPVSAPASELFGGAIPAEEMEVKAVMRFCKSHSLRAALSFHAKGESIQYADTATAGKIPQASTLARRISDISGYTVMPVSDNPGIFAGSFESWFREAFLRPALLVKLSPAVNGAMPLDEKEFFSVVWKKARYICAQALTVLRDG